MTMFPTSSVGVRKGIVDVFLGRVTNPLCYCLSVSPFTRTCSYTAGLT